MAETSRVAIVTDSTADLPPALRSRLDIAMVPLNIHFGSETYRDQIDLSTEEFMTLLANTQSLPAMSQPSPDAFEQTFRNLAATGRYDEIVCVLISSRLSGTVRSAQAAASTVRDVIKVEVVDSLNTSLGCGYQVLNAHDLAAEGIRAEEIAITLRAQIDRYHVIFFAETLSYLRRSGRVGKAASLVGSSLRLKPLLRIDEGQVVPFERARARKNAIEALVDFAENLPNIERIAVFHSSSPQDAADLYERVGSLARQEPVIQVNAFGPVLSTHVGPGALGLAIEVAASE